MFRIQRLFTFAFWAAAMFAYVVAVLPDADAPSFSSSDKVEHMVAFFTLAILARLAHPRWSFLALAALLGAFGAFIEFSQMIPAIHRDASLWDWYADMAAVGAGLLVAGLATRRIAAG
jgi:VanZ family protein